MSARSTRQEARVRILAVFQAQLDRMIPEDETIPLKGAMFTDFEDQVEGLARAALGKDAPEVLVLAEQLKDDLWAGRVDQVIALQ